MRTNNALKNISLGFLNKFIVLALTFFVTPVIFNGLGKELYGINALVFQTIGYLGLAELGISTTATVALYKTLASQDEHESNKILAATHMLYRFIGLAILIIGFFISFFLHKIFSIPNNLINVAQIAFLIYLLKSGISYFFSIPFIALNAAQKGYKIGWLETIASPLTLLFNFIVIKLGYHIIGLAGVALIISLVTISIQFFIAKRTLPWMKLNYPEKNYRHLKDTRFVFVDRLLVLGVFQTDFLLISYFLGPGFVANYALYTTFFTLLRDICWIGLSNITSGIGEMFAKEMYHNIFNLWKDIVTIVFYFIIFSLPVLFYVFSDFITLWVGDRALLPANVLAFFLVNLCYLLLVHVSTVFVNAKGNFKERMYGSLAELTINISLSIILIPHLGILGAIMGTTIGHLSINSWFIPLLLFRSLNKDYKIYLFMVFKYLLIGLIVWIIIFYVNTYLLTYISRLTWWTLIIKGTILSICSVMFTTIIVYLVDPDFKSVFYRVNSILLKFRRRNSNLII